MEFSLKSAHARDTFGTQHEAGQEKGEERGEKGQRAELGQQRRTVA